MVLGRVHEYMSSLLVGIGYYPPGDPVEEEREWLCDCQGGVGQGDVTGVEDHHRHPRLLGHRAVAPPHPPGEAEHGLGRRQIEGTGCVRAE